MLTASAAHAPALSGDDECAQCVHGRRLDVVRKQLAHPGWSRILGIREKGELTEIYLWKEGDTNGGLAVISA